MVILCVCRPICRETTKKTSFTINAASVGCLVSFQLFWSLTLYRSSSSGSIIKLVGWELCSLTVKSRIGRTRKVSLHLMWYKPTVYYSEIILTSCWYFFVSVCVMSVWVYYRDTSFCTNNITYGTRVHLTSIIFKLVILVSFRLERGTWSVSQLKTTCFWFETKQFAGWQLCSVPRLPMNDLATLLWRRDRSW